MSKFQVQSIRRSWRCLAFVALIVPSATGIGHAASLSPKDVQVIGKAISFMEPAPSGTPTVAIAYNAAEPASKQDAEAIAAFFGDGLKAGNATLKPKVVAAGDIAGGGFLVVIAAQGAMTDALAGATRAQHALCVTADAAAVQSGACVVSVKSSPTVEITVNKAAATAAGISFGSTFMMMAHQI